MQRQTLTYTDFNDNERTEDFYFSLTEAEITEWMLRENFTGGLAEHLDAVVKSNDGNRIMDAFRDILIRSYGIKSEDGRTFTKSPEISSGFLGSNAYSKLFMMLMEDPTWSSKFISGIVPKSFQEEAAKHAAPKAPQDFMKKKPVEAPVPELETTSPVWEQEDKAEDEEPKVDMSYEEYLRWKAEQV